MGGSLNFLGGEDQILRTAELPEGNASGRGKALTASDLDGVRSRAAQGQTIGETFDNNLNLEYSAFTRRDLQAAGARLGSVRDEKFESPSEPSEDALTMEA